MPIGGLRKSRNGAASKFQSFDDASCMSDDDFLRDLKQLSSPQQASSDKKQKNKQPSQETKRQNLAVTPGSPEVRRRTRSHSPAHSRKSRSLSRERNTEHKSTVRGPRTISRSPERNTPEVVASATSFVTPGRNRKVYPVDNPETTQAPKTTGAPPAKKKPTPRKRRPSLWRSSATKEDPPVDVDEDEDDEPTEATTAIPQTPELHDLSQEAPQFLPSCVAAARTDPSPGVTESPPEPQPQQPPPQEKTTANRRKNFVRAPSLEASLDGLENMVPPNPYQKSLKSKEGDDQTTVTQKTQSTTFSQFLLSPLKATFRRARSLPPESRNGEEGEEGEDDDKDAGGAEGQGKDPEVAEGQSKDPEEAHGQDKGSEVADEQGGSKEPEDPPRRSRTSPSPSPSSSPRKSRGRDRRPRRASMNGAIGVESSLVKKQDFDSPLQQGRALHASTGDFSSLMLECKHEEPLEGGQPRRQSRHSESSHQRPRRRGVRTSSSRGLGAMPDKIQPSERNSSTNYTQGQSQEQDKSEGPRSGSNSPRRRMKSSQGNVESVENSGGTEYGTSTSGKEERRQKPSSSPRTHKDAVDIAPGTPLQTREGEPVTGHGSSLPTERPPQAPARREAGEGTKMQRAVDGRGSVRAGRRSTGVDSTIAQQQSRAADPSMDGRGEEDGHFEDKTEPELDKTSPAHNLSKHDKNDVIREHTGENFDTQDKTKEPLQRPTESGELPRETESPQKKNAEGEGTFSPQKNPNQPPGESAKEGSPESESPARRKPRTSYSVPKDADTDVGNHDSPRRRSRRVSSNKTSVPRSSNGRSVDETDPTRSRPTQGDKNNELQTEKLGSPLRISVRTARTLQESIRSQGSSSSSPGSCEVKLRVSKRSSHSCGAQTSSSAGLRNDHQGEDVNIGDDDTQVLVVERKTADMINRLERVLDDANGGVLRERYIAMLREKHGNSAAADNPKTPSRRMRRNSIAAMPTDVDTYYLNTPGGMAASQHNSGFERPQRSPRASLTLTDELPFINTQSVSQTCLGAIKPVGGSKGLSMISPAAGKKDSTRSCCSLSPVGTKEQTHEQMPVAEKNGTNSSLSDVLTPSRSVDRVLKILDLMSPTSRGTYDPSQMVSYMVPSEGSSKRSPRHKTLQRSGSGDSGDFSVSRLDIPEISKHPSSNSGPSRTERLKQAVQRDAQHARNSPEKRNRSVPRSSTEELTRTSPSPTSVIEKDAAVTKREQEHLASQDNGCRPEGGFSEAPSSGQAGSEADSSWSTSASALAGEPGCASPCEYNESELATGLQADTLNDKEFIDTEGLLPNSEGEKDEENPSQLAEGNRRSKDDVEMNQKPSRRRPSMTAGTYGYGEDDVALEMNQKPSRRRPSMKAGTYGEDDNQKRSRRRPSMKAGTYGEEDNQKPSRRRPSMRAGTYGEDDVALETNQKPSRRRPSMKAGTYGYGEDDVALESNQKPSRRRPSMKAGTYGYGEDDVALESNPRSSRRRPSMKAGASGEEDNQKRSRRRPSMKADTCGEDDVALEMNQKPSRRRPSMKAGTYGEEDNQKRSRRRPSMKAESYGYGEDDVVLEMNQKPSRRRPSMKAGTYGEDDNQKPSRRRPSMKAGTYGYGEDDVALETNQKSSRRRPSMKAGAPGEEDNQKRSRRRPSMKADTYGEDDVALEMNQKSSRRRPSMKAGTSGANDAAFETNEKRSTSARRRPSMKAEISLRQSYHEKEDVKGYHDGSVRGNRCHDQRAKEQRRSGSKLSREPEGSADAGRRTKEPAKKSKPGLDVMKVITESSKRPPKPGLHDSIQNLDVTSWMESADRSVAATLDNQRMKRRNSSHSAVAAQLTFGSEDRNLPVQYADVESLYFKVKSNPV